MSCVRRYTLAEFGRHGWGIYDASRHELAVYGHYEFAEEDAASGLFDLIEWDSTRDEFEWTPLPRDVQPTSVRTLQEAANDGLV